MAQMSGFVWTASAGETFDMIALAVYGNEKYACDLMDANPKWVQTARFEGVSGWARLPDGAGTSLK